MNINTVSRLFFDDFSKLTKSKNTLAWNTACKNAMSEKKDEKSASISGLNRTEEAGAEGLE